MNLAKYFTKNSLVIPKGLFFGIMKSILQAMIIQEDGIILLQFGATICLLWAQTQRVSRQNHQSEVEDPVLLRAPAFETEGPNAPTGGGRPPRRMRRDR